MTVSDLLDRCSSAELTEWQAFFELEAADRAKADQRAKAQRDRPAGGETMGRPSGQAAEVIAAYQAQEDVA